MESAFPSIVLKSLLVVVAVNDLIDVDYLAYLLRYDSTHRQFQGDVRVENKNLIVSVPSGNLGNITAGIIAKKEIEVFSFENPSR